MEHSEVCMECDGSPDRLLWWIDKKGALHCRPCSRCYRDGYDRWARSRSGLIEDRAEAMRSVPAWLRAS